MRKAIFFEKLSSNKVKCIACRHNCVISENCFGVCGVRKNIGGELFLLTHSKPCSLHLDPIEKKPLFHYFPGSKTMSIGFFGCNFRCSFCQNFEISQLKFTELEKQLSNFSESELVAPSDFVGFALKNNAKSIAFTYNEPIISIEYAIDCFDFLDESNINLGRVFVSNGYSSDESIKALKNRLSAINIDLKSFSEKFYRDICGAELENVLKTIKAFYKQKTWIEITTLLIPKRNNSVGELKQIASFIASIDVNIPWHVSVAHPDYKMLDFEPISDKELEKAIKIGFDQGLNFVYGGNTRVMAFEETRCPKCKSLLVSRSYFSSKIVGLVVKNGKAKCSNCGEKIKGVF